MSDVLIKVFVDVLSALYSDSLEGNVYGFDTHLSHGSQGFGGQELVTSVHSGDKIFWSAISLECEAPITLSGVEFHSEEFSSVPVQQNGLHVMQMITPEITSLQPYTLHFTFGKHGKEMSLASGFTLCPIGESHV
jgi:hypothetical protein